MTDDTRLAEITMRANADKEYGYMADLPCVEDRMWLLSRVRALEAQAALDGAVIEAVVAVDRTDSPYGSGVWALRKMTDNNGDGYFEDAWEAVTNLEGLLTALAARDARGEGEE
jgi:hypothetical protein